MMNRERFPVFLAMTAALLIFTGSARAQDPALRGRALVKDLCARCHAIDRPDVSPRPAAPPFRDIGQSLELDGLAERLRDGLASSHRDMPEFRFNEDDAGAVVAYLRSIQQ